MTKFTIVREQLVYRRVAPDQVRFTQSSFKDPYIQRGLMLISQVSGKSPQEVQALVQKQVDKHQANADKSPLLYGTIAKNIPETILFGLMQKFPITGALSAPKFSPRVFNKLVNTIAAEHDEFWPLRGFIDKRRLTPIYEFVDGDPNDEKTEISTAAATPGGRFIFNLHFMQTLMDFALLKQLTPKGRKYVGNGGDIANEYCYIEFLIMHELMHYSHDEFYYQHIIPNARPRVINWVGDFRSNYLLVKSGYEQLPIGLFNDNINYDRQKTYMEMYNTILDELKRIRDKDGDKGDGEGGSVGDGLDDLSDDHEPGQAEGKEAEVRESSTGEIDQNDKQIDKQIEQGKDKTAKEAADEAKEKSEQPGDGPSQAPGKGGANGDFNIDYANIRPTFNWKALITRFISTAKPKQFETFMKPARRSVSGLFTVSQTGAAAVKPGVVNSDESEAKIAFCLDSSGSMSGVINTVMSNVVSLMRQPAFIKTNVTVVKFSSDSEIFTCNMARKVASKVTNIGDAGPMNTPLSDVLGIHYGAGTDFSVALADKLRHALSSKYNIIIVSDTDILHSQNYEQFISLVKAYPKQVFVIFDSRDTYIQFRRQASMSTPNITHF